MNEKRQDGEKRVRGKWGGMEERVQIIEERREASVDSFDRKPQLLAEKYYTHTHAHTAAGDISFNPEWPRIETMQLRRTTPLFHSVCVCVC